MTMNIQEIAIAKIVADPHNARKTFDLEKIQGIADTIQEVGLQNPVSVRIAAEGHYQLVSGENRLRAFKTLERETIPAIVVEMDDATATLAGLVENLARVDLDPFEEGTAYKRAMAAHNWDQKTLAAKLGKPKSTICSAIKRAAIEEGTRKVMAEQKWSGSVIDTVATLEDGSLIEFVQACGDKAPTLKQARAFKASGELPGSGDRIEHVAPVTPDLASKGKDGELTGLVQGLHVCTEQLGRFGKTKRGREVLAGQGGVDFRRQLSELQAMAESLGI